jgi:hypothetical protein
MKRGLSPETFETNSKYSQVQSNLLVNRLEEYYDQLKEDDFEKTERIVERAVHWSLVNGKI